MVSKVFVLSIAQLCTKKTQAEDNNSFNVKHEEIKPARILVQKENAGEMARKVSYRDLPQT